MKSVFSESEKDKIHHDFSPVLGKSYVEALLRWAEERSTDRFLNDSTDHARLVALLTIGKAQQTVDIFTDALIPDCYKPAFENLKNSNTEIRILAETPSKADWVRQLIPNVQIRLAPRDSKLTSHFFVVDGCAFREEINHDLKTARASFNDPEKVKELHRLFNAVWSTLPAEQRRAELPAT